MDVKRKKKRRGVSGLSLKKGRDSQGMSFAFSVALSLFRVFYLNLSTGDGFRWVTVI